MSQWRSAPRSDSTTQARSTNMSAPAPANDDGLFQAPLAESEIPAGVDRRSFLVRHGVIGAAAVMTGATWTPEARAAQAAKEAGPPKQGAALSPDLEVVKQSK